MREHTETLSDTRPGAPKKKEGEPKLANIEAGPYLAGLYNDSPELATGSNVLTVKIPGLSAEHSFQEPLLEVDQYLNDALR